MNTIRTIVLYGNSLTVSSIGASLENKPGMRVVRLKDILFADLPQLDALAPDVLIFDSNATSSDWALTLLKERPTLLLLGVDLLSGRMLVFSSRQSSALTTADLINVIEHRSAILNRADEKPEVIARDSRTKNRAFNPDWKSNKRMEEMKVQALFAKWAGLNQRARVLVSIAAVIILLLIVGSVAMVVVGDQVNEVASSMFGAANSPIRFYPDPVCIGVGDKMQAKMSGWDWGKTKWESGDSGIATASGRGEITGVKVGETQMRLKGATGVVTLKELPVTVKAETGDCASVYMKNVDTTPAQYGGQNMFRFVFVSDTKGCPGCAADGSPNLVDHDFAKWFADQMLVENPAFIVNGGDISGLGGSGKQNEKQWLDDIAKVWKNGSVPTGKTAIPIYAVVGNDDLTRDILGKYYRTKQVEWQNDLWHWYFTNGGKQWPTNSSSDYKYLTYSFTYGNSVFVFTDSYYMWGDTGTDADWQGNMMFQEINPPQIAYALKQAQWAKSNGKAHLFVFGHTPVIASSAVNNQLLTKLLGSSGLSGAYLSGHTGGLAQSMTNSAPPYYLQITDTLGGGDNDPNSYLRVEVNGSAWKVTAIFRYHDGTVLEGKKKDGTTWVWTYAQ